MKILSAIWFWTIFPFSLLLLLAAWALAVLAALSFEGTGEFFGALIEKKAPKNARP